MYLIKIEYQSIKKYFIAVFKETKSFVEKVTF